MRRGRNRTIGLLAVLALAAPAVAVAAGDPGETAAGPATPHCHDAPAPAAASAPAETGTRVTVADVPLVDQERKGVRFAEVAGDRIVVVNFVYTSCTTVCPVLSGLFSSLQDRLGEKLGSRVQLVSVSIDPARDTPERLAAMAARHRAKPGWRWLTGAPEHVETLLRGFGTYSPDPAQHAPAVLVGDPRRQRWFRLNGFPTAEALAAKVHQLLAERLAGAEMER
jgi:protein SCO1/2